ncbi:MAG: hypothetical protein J6O89_00950 [Aeriscardovia sp.]|nr:hypothetical protein [Aeriscardovia sp.]
MTFNPLYHPRRPDGKFRDAFMSEGWHGYMDKRGSCHFYYVHNRENLKDGFAVLQMAGSGRPMTLTDVDPHSRAHVIDSGEGEQMMCSSSYHGAFGITDHDSPAPPVSFSLSRASFRFQSDAGRKVDEMQEMQDNRTLPYSTIEPFKAYRYLEKGMQKDDELGIENYLNPGSVADEVIEIRKKLRKKLDIKDSYALRHIPVYLSIEGEKLKISEGLEAKGKGRLVAAKRPAGSVNVDSADVTRLMRALQEEDPNGKVRYTIGRCADGKTLGLQIVKDFRGKDGHEKTMWGILAPRTPGIKTLRVKGGQVSPERNFQKQETRARKEIKKRSSSSGWKKTERGKELLNAFRQARKKAKREAQEAA